MHEIIHLTPMSADEISVAEDEPVLIEWRGVRDGNGNGGLNEDTALRARIERPSRRAVEQLRIVLAEVVPDDPAGKRKLRRIAEKLVEAALDGQSWAIQQVADRIDGKPAQESTVNIKEKREASDWTREELMALLEKHRKQDDTKQDDTKPTAPSTDSLN